MAGRSRPRATARITTTSASARWTGSSTSTKGASTDEVRAAMADHVLDEGELVGIYQS